MQIGWSLHAVCYRVYMHLVVDPEADEDRLEHEQRANDRQQEQEQEPHVHETLAEERQPVVGRELVPFLDHGKDLNVVQQHQWLVARAPSHADLPFRRSCRISTSCTGRSALDARG